MSVTTTSGSCAVIACRRLSASGQDATTRMSGAARRRAATPSRTSRLSSASTTDRTIGQVDHPRVVLASMTPVVPAICRPSRPATMLISMRTAHRTTLLATVCGLAVLASCTTGQPAGDSANTAAHSPGTGPVDGLVDIGGGRSIYATCTGRGSPTVVLIAGKGNGAQDWQELLAPGDPAHDAPGDDVSAGMGALEPSDAAVFPATARLTRVCTYDRPDVRSEGPDISTSRPQPHTVDQDVDDLRALLTALGEPPPYVLVAHSYGGLIASLFAQTDPQPVGGLVVVDAGSALTADVPR